MDVTQLSHKASHKHDIIILMMIYFARLMLLKKIPFGFSLRYISLIKKSIKKFSWIFFVSIPCKLHKN
jgi:hypothetical protein